MRIKEASLSLGGLFIMCEGLNKNRDIMKRVFRHRIIGPQNGK